MPEEPLAQSLDWLAQLRLPEFGEMLITGASFSEQGPTFELPAPTIQLSSSLDDRFN